MKGAVIMRRIFLLLSLAIVLTGFMQSCSVGIIGGRESYSPEFLKKYESVQIIYRDGDKKRALAKLDAINDEVITDAEKAKKYNLKGIILFSLPDIERATENFLVANQYVSRDQSLSNNIKLNLASSYFKQAKYDLVTKWLGQIDTDYLKAKEKISYYKLSFSVGAHLQDHRRVVNSLIYLTHNLKSFKQFEDYKYKEILLDHFKKLSSSERIDVLDKNKDISPATIAYLAKQEAMNRFYKGDKGGSQDVVDWMGKEFSSLEDVRLFVSDYKYRLENFSKINSGAIGIVAPISGRFGRYGKKIIAGVNTALSEAKDGHGLNLYVRDNKNNAFLARNQIKELALKYHVSAVIGGLFPHLAKQEYMEARKYGIFYISLSPVYLPRSEKDHLLVEVPGSVESQINGMLKSDVLDYFGKRVAVLYPWSDEGKSYVNELWSLHNSEKLQLMGVNHFKKGISDYREPIKSLLGLKYPREREEEYQIWNEIKNVNKRNVRIINVLPPVVDFDWILIPSLPKEAIQILPTFAFFDAKDLKLVGGPSWINKKLQRQRKSVDGRMFVIGNDTKAIGADFIELYKKHNGTAPHLVDTLSFEGMNIVMKVLEGQKFDERDELVKRVSNFSTLKGLTSKWELEDGIWIKDMDILEIQRSGINKIRI